MIRADRDTPHIWLQAGMWWYGSREFIYSARTVRDIIAFVRGMQ